MKKPLVLALAICAAVGFAAPAQADENAYLQEIRQPNKLFISITNGQLLQLGYMACQTMRANISSGMPMSNARAQADSAVAQTAYSMGLASDRASNMNITTAAEHNLC